MLSLLDVAAHFESMEWQLKFRLDAELRVLMEAGAEKAKALIGQEREQWPPLAESTIAEKEALGFVNQVSATDPLLRTGELRESIHGEAEATEFGAEGIIASTSEIGLYQEAGTHTIPPRPFTVAPMIDAEMAADHAFGELGIKLLTPGRTL